MGVMHPEVATRAADRRIAALAARQYGVVSRAQLRSAGLSDEAVKTRVRAARLHRLHHGAYAVGHTRVSRSGRFLAAVLACGDRAGLCGRSAAANFGIRRQASGPVEVIVASANGRTQRPGIRLHRSSTLSLDELIVHDGIRTTGPARTLRDLKRLLDPQGYRAAIRQAEILRLDTGALGYVDDNTRSELERRLLRLVRAASLPRPERNAAVGSFVVDFLWRDAKLIVETDGFETHGVRTAFAADRRRDVELRLLGYTVLRFTYDDVTRDPDYVVASIAALLQG